MNISMEKNTKIKPFTPLNIFRCLECNLIPSFSFASINNNFSIQYICPNNQVLKYSTTNRDGYREFKSNGKECASCPYLSQCTKSKNHVKVITEHVWNNYLEEAAETRYTLGSSDIYAKRKETIERCFADGKENFGLRFTRYKGIRRVTQSLLLLFACMNFKKMAKWKAMMA